MTQPIIRLKRSSVPGKIPTTISLPVGEFGINTNDGKVYIQKDSVGIGSTVIVVNPWSVGLGSNTYNTFFTVGNVGIGTTIPTSSLHVVGNTLSTGIVTALGGFNLGIQSGGISVTAGVLTALNFIGAGNSFVYNSGTKTIDIDIGGGQWTYADTSNTATSNIYRLNGNVGIGTTNPGYKLDVTGNLNFTGTLFKNGVEYVSGIGIQSGGSFVVGSGVTILNFVGSAVSTITNSGSGLVEINVKAGQFTRGTSTFTATAGQTSFSVNYTPNFIDVFLNGVRLTSSEFTATNGTSVVLTDAAFVDDIIDVVVFQNSGLFDSSKWSAETPLTPSSGNIYRVSGNVGIGTTSGKARLDIEGVLGVDTTVTGITTTAISTIDTLPISIYRSARFQVQITQSTDYQSTDLMVVHNGTTANIIEYGSVATNDYLASFSSTISASNLLLQATMSIAGIATVKVVRYGVTI